MLGKASACSVARVRGIVTRHELKALKFLPAGTNVPWHRVISSSGAISSRGPGTNGAERQRRALEAEGVEVLVGRTGELHVSLAEYGWFPATLHNAVPDEDDDQNDEEDL